MHLALHLHAFRPAYDPAGFTRQQLLQRFRPGSALHFQRIAGSQAQLDLRVKPRELGQRQHDETADHVLFAGPVAQPLVEGQRPGGSSRVVPCRHKGAVVAALGPVGGDGGGAGETHRGGVVFKLRLRPLPGPPRQLLRSLGSGRLGGLEAQEVLHGQPPIGNDDLQDGPRRPADAKQPSHCLRARSRYGQDRFVRRGVKLFNLRAKGFKHQGMYLRAL